VAALTRLVLALAVAVSIAAAVVATQVADATSLLVVGLGNALLAAALWVRLRNA